MRLTPLALLVAAASLSACASTSPPKAPLPTDTVWKTLNAEQWDIDPATIAVPPMPGAR